MLLRCRGLFVTLFAAIKLSRLRPDVVVGSGGHVCFPTCLAAAMLRKPLIVIEPDAYPGLINRYLCPLCTLVLTLFKPSPKHVPSGKCAPVS